MRNKGLWFVVKALLALILIGLLVAGGFAIHYVSWSQGYAAGQQAGEAEEGKAVTGPLPLPYPQRGFHASGHLGLVRPLLCLGGLAGLVGVPAEDYQVNLVLYGVIDEPVQRSEEVSEARGKPGRWVGVAVGLNAEVQVGEMEDFQPILL